MMRADQPSRLADLPLLREPRVFDAVLKAADVHGLWNPLLPLVRWMSPEIERRVLQRADRLGVLAKLQAAWEGAAKER